MHVYVPLFYLRFLCRFDFLSKQPPKPPHSRQQIAARCTLHAPLWALPLLLVMPHFRRLISSHDSIVIYSQQSGRSKSKSRSSSSNGSGSHSRQHSIKYCWLPFSQSHTALSWGISLPPKPALARDASSLSLGLLLPQQPLLLPLSCCRLQLPLRLETLP